MPGQRSPTAAVQQDNVHGALLMSTSVKLKTLRPHTLDDTSLLSLTLLLLMSLAASVVKLIPKHEVDPRDKFCWERHRLVVYRYMEPSSNEK
eukprot:2769171-Amphidinium_carterae.1